MVEDLPWKDKAADMRRKGFSETEISKTKPRRSVRAKAGHLTEYEEQKRFVKWVRTNMPDHSRRLLSTGNAGHRGSLIRVSMDKAAGLLPGASDLFFRLPVGQWHGLWIEMKTEIGKATPEEEKFLWEARRDGYAGVVCQGQEAAKTALRKYLRGEDPAA